MTSLSERLSVVRPQWEAQIDAFQTLTTRAFDSAEQLCALNLKTSRATLEQATGTLQQLLYVRDPRELLAIGSQAQGQWEHMFSYSRELLGIAMGARQRPWTSLPLAPLQLAAPLLPAPAAHVVEQAGMAVAEAVTVGSEIATAAAESNAALAEDTLGVGDQSGAGTGAIAEAPARIVPDAAPAAPSKAPGIAPSTAPTELDAEKTGAAPSETPAAKPAAAFASAAEIEAETSANVDALIDIVRADEAPPAKAKPLVEAMSELVHKAVSADHPISASVPLDAVKHIELPLVTPADATPPVRLSNGPTAAERRRASRKKS